MKTQKCESIKCKTELNHMLNRTSLINRLINPTAKCRVSYNLYNLWIPVVLAESSKEDEKKENKLGTIETIKSVFVPLPSHISGWERVKSIYTLNQYREVGPEWTTIVHCFIWGGIGGALIGGFTAAREARNLYVERNEGTLYTNEMAARRALTDRITLSFAANAFRQGWRGALFSGMYVFIVTHLSVYFNKTYLMNYVAAGGISGGLWKFMQGPTAALVGSGLGATLGLVCGSLSNALFYITGTSLEEIRYYHYDSHVKKPTEVDMEIPVVKLQDMPVKSPKEAYTSNR